MCSLGVENHHFPLTKPVAVRSSGDDVLGLYKLTFCVKDLLYIRPTIKNSIFVTFGVKSELRTSFGLITKREKESLSFARWHQFLSEDVDSSYRPDSYKASQKSDN